MEGNFRSGKIDVNVEQSLGEGIDYRCFLFSAFFIFIFSVMTNIAFVIRKGNFLLFFLKSAV